VLNTARSSLSSLILLPQGGHFGSHPDVKIYMQGALNQLPPKPRYTSTWDVEVVLEFLKTWSPATKIPIDKLSMKLVMLILLVSGQRPQIIKALKVDSMQVSPSSYKFVVANKDIKQGRSGYKPGEVLLKSYPADKRLCVHNYMTVYLERTLDVRGKTQELVLTTKKPIKAASTDSVARWVKTVMHQAGIDVSVYTAGSVRSASSSKAKQGGASMEEIMRAGGWARKSTFATFYDKPICKKNKGFQEAVLG